MSQGRLSLVKKFRLSPEVATELAEKAEKMSMSETNKEQLVAYMRKLNIEVNKVYEVISERKSGNM